MATKLTPPAQISPMVLFKDSATQETLPGTRMGDGTGREFVYVKAGGTALVPGKLQQAPVEIANHQNLVATTAAIGSTTLTVTLGGTAATANQYAGGYVVIAAGTGLGYTYKIKSHPAQTSTSGTVVLTLEEPIKVATLTSDSKADLVLNQYNGVILWAHSTTGRVVGVAVYPITAAYYGWIQVKGECNLLSDGGWSAGQSLSGSNATDGAAEVQVAGQAIIGNATCAASTTEYGAVCLEL